MLDGFKLQMNVDDPLFSLHQMFLAKSTVTRKSTSSHSQIQELKTAGALRFAYVQMFGQLFTYTVAAVDDRFNFMSIWLCLYFFFVCHWFHVYINSIFYVCAHEPNFCLYKAIFAWTICLSYTLFWCFPSSFFVSVFFLCICSCCSLLKTTSEQINFFPRRGYSAIIDKQIVQITE